MNDPAEIPHDQVEFSGIAVAKSGENQRHVGFVFKSNDDEKSLFCHLAWHLKLCFDPPADWRVNEQRGKLFWKNLSLTKLNRMFLAGFLRDIQANNTGNELTYGFDMPLPCFDEDGKYVPTDEGKGLTCATFVLAVYENLKYPLLDIAEWPNRDEDEEWQNKILDWLKQSGVASQKHLDAMKQDVGSVRLKPEEVAAAAIFDPLPISFEDCVREAEEIKQIVMQ